MRKLCSLILVLALLPLCVFAEEPVLGITPLTEVIRPGRAVLLSFSVPESGTADLCLTDAQGVPVSVAVMGLRVSAGLNHVWWNGTYESVPAPQGSWQLTLTQNGRSTSVPVTVGPMAPYLTAISPMNTVLTPEVGMSVSFYASCAGVLRTSLITADGGSEPLAEWAITAGNNSVTWTGIGQNDGRYQFEMQLTDGTGDVSEAERFPITLSGFNAYYSDRAAEQAALDADSDETFVEDDTEAEPADAPDSSFWTIPDEAGAEDAEAPEALPDGAAAGEDPEETPEALPEDAGEADEILPDEAEDIPDAEAEDVPDAEAEDVPDAETEGGGEPDEPSEDAEDFSEEAEDIPDVLIDDVALPDADEGAAAAAVRESAYGLVASCGEDQKVFTPSYSSPYAGQDPTVNYWTTPMNIADEEAVWKILMEPITVLDNGKSKAERMQVVIRAEPSDESEALGLATCITQGVHVLERGETWSLIECYSSSFYATTVEAWNLLVQGYVPTKYLKTVTPSQRFGLVVDKLTQRLYIFKDGRLFDTLLVSTGLTNAKQPFNETRSGEFLLQNPAVGEFRSDNIYCSMGIRFNDGDLLHEVPHLKMADGGKTYKTTEYKLGTKASHGCIRVQRRRTPQGVNMKWIWDNRANNVKILIWEDWQGRQLSSPAGDTVVYYNPDKGSMYHSCETCRSAVGKTFTPFLYSQLDDEPFSKLTRCEWCNPPLRKGEIAAINETYAPGGDHDPILTKAQQRFLNGR